MEKNKMKKAYKSLYRNEFKLQKKPIFWWFGILGVMILINVLIYPLIDSILGSMTAEERQDMINLGINLDYSSITSYFLVECVQAHIVGGALFASCFASLAIARDFKYGTYELLYTNALSRKQIVLTKYNAMVSMVLFLNVFLMVIELIGMSIIDFKGIQIVPILAFILFGTLAQIIVASIVFGLVLLKPQKRGIGIALAIPLLLYFVSTLALGLGANANWVEYLSIFSIFYNINVANPFDINYAILGIFVAIAVFVMWMGIKRNEKIDY